MGRVFEKDSTTQRQPHKSLTSQSGVKGNSRSLSYFSVCDSFGKFLKVLNMNFEEEKQLESNWKKTDP